MGEQEEDSVSFATLIKWDSKRQFMGSKLLSYIQNYTSCTFLAC